MLAKKLSSQPESTLRKSKQAMRKTFLKPKYRDKGCHFQTNIFYGETLQKEKFLIPSCLKTYGFDLKKKNNLAKNFFFGELLKKKKTN